MRNNKSKENSVKLGGKFMVIPIVPILIALILLALLWWVATQLVSDPMLLKIIRVVVVVLAVLWIVGLLSGYGPQVTFR